MSEGTSFVELPSEKVIVLSKQCLEKLRDERKNRLLSEVESYKTDPIIKFWFFITRRPIPTDREIIGRLGKLDLLEKLEASTWTTENIFNNGSGGIASKLLIATQHADKVSVSIYDLAMITSTTHG